MLIGVVVGEVNSTHLYLAVDSKDKVGRFMRMPGFGNLTPADEWQHNSQENRIKPDQPLSPGRDCSAVMILAYFLLHNCVGRKSLLFRTMMHG